MDQLDSSTHAVATAGGYIRSQRDYLINLWLTRVRAEIPAARDKTEYELIDNMPNYLISVADLLDDPASTEHAENVDRFCRIHADQRSHLPGYRIEDVMTEHNILRDVCFPQLIQNINLSTDQARLLSNAIFRGVLASSAIFSAVLLSKHQDAIKNLEMERETREHLVTSLTHDLRQPLQIIRINAQILQREADRDKQFRFINKIIEHSERAASMLDDLLDANRLRAGEKLRLNLESFDLQHLATAVCGDLATSHGDRFFCMHGPPVVGNWDAAKLRRALENLLTNAVKYGWQHTPITVTVRDYGQTVDCSVHNFGEPIAREQLGLIFERYYRTPVARRTGSKGWGVGLALVKGIAEAHGGTATADSTEAGGTTFTMTLPKDVPASEQPQHSAT